MLPTRCPSRPRRGSLAGLLVLATACRAEPRPQTSTPVTAERVAPASASAPPPGAPPAARPLPPPGSLAAGYTFHPYPDVPLGDVAQGIFDLGEKLVAIDGVTISEIVEGERIERKELLAGLPIEPGLDLLVGLHGVWPSKAFVVVNFARGDCPTHAVYQWDHRQWKHVLGPKSPDGLASSKFLCSTFPVYGPWANGTLLGSGATLGGRAPLLDLKGMNVSWDSGRATCDLLRALSPLPSGHAFAVVQRCAPGATDAHSVIASWAPGSTRPKRESLFPKPAGCKDLSVGSMLAVSELEVYAAGSCDDEGYLAVFDGDAWTTVSMPQTKSIQVAARGVWLLVDGVPYVGAPERDGAGRPKNVASLTPGSGARGSFARVALPKALADAQLIDVIARASGEVLLSSDHLLASTVPPKRGPFAEKPRP